MSFIDLTGKRFGRALVLKQVGKNKRNEILWVCKCDCDKEFTTSGRSLRRGNTKSCGCLNDEQRRVSRRKTNLVGQIFGRLMVIGVVQVEKYSNSKCLCRCECGNEKEYLYLNLKRGKTKSCGCYGLERAIEANTKHGNCTHRGSSPEYVSWQSMKYRCLNEDNQAYKWYGAIGVKVCERWLGVNGFKNFIADMGQRPSPLHTLDRYPNNKGNYEPSNCRWATWKEQQGNRTNNVWFECFGKKMILQDWSNYFKVTNGAVVYQLKNKSFEEVFLFYEKKNKKIA